MIRRILLILVGVLWTFCADAVRINEETLSDFDTFSTPSRTESPQNDGSDSLLNSRKRIKFTTEDVGEHHFLADPQDSFIAIPVQTGIISVRADLEEDTGLFQETPRGRFYIPLASFSHIHWTNISLELSDCHMAAMGFSSGLRICILDETGLTLPKTLLFEQALRNKPLLRELRIIQKNSPLSDMEFSIIARTVLYSPWLQHVQIHSPTFEDSALEVMLSTLTHCNIKTFEMGYGISAVGLRNTLKFLTQEGELSLEECSLWLSGKFEFSDFTELPSVFTRFPNIKFSFIFMPGSLLNSSLFSSHTKTYDRVQFDQMVRMYAHRVELSFL